MRSGGNPDVDQAHYYFGKPDWPAAFEFTQVLRDLPYFWWGRRTPAIELAAVQNDRAEVPAVGDSLTTRGKKGNLRITA